MTIEKLKDCVEKMKKDGLTEYAACIEELIPKLQDVPKKHVMTDTEKQMLGNCESIRDTLEQFEEGMYYDTEEYKMVRADDINHEDENSDERYMDFTEYYLYDNYGLRILSGICSGKQQYRGCQICVATGGPGIWIDTTTGNIEGYWWGERCSVPMTQDVIDMIDRYVEYFMEEFI